ncbi:MAG: NAD(P)H-hydrate dehydratase [Planctomycetota bacterium]|jgi:NAD(P)H-hydrate epimerase
MAERLPALPSLDSADHKGSRGRVLVVAGSRGMVGAAALAGQAALRSGAGLVTIACPQSVYPILAAKVTCAMTLPLPETETGSLGHAACDALIEFSRGMDAVAIGPGLGRHPETVAVVLRLLSSLERPFVLDADGLTALVGAMERLIQVQAPGVFTPHPGEMARLLGVTPAHVQADRAGSLDRFLQRVGSDHTALLKGAGTLVGTGEGRRFTNTSGNAGLATGGTGDVLTGVIAGFLAQGMPPFAAACLGAHVHGLAGDLAAKRLGQRGMIATDVLEAIPSALRRYEGSAS